MRHPRIHDIARRTRTTPAPVVFRFAQQIGMVALTGTTSPEHMKQDLEARHVELDADEVAAIERLIA